MATSRPRPAAKLARKGCNVRDLIERNRQPLHVVSKGWLHKITFMNDNTSCLCTWVAHSLMLTTASETPCSIIAIQRTARIMYKHRQSRYYAQRFNNRMHGMKTHDEICETHSGSENKHVRKCQSGHAQEMLPNAWNAKTDNKTITQKNKINLQQKMKQH